jgi:hypothetical protein
VQYDTSAHTVAVYIGVARSRCAVTGIKDTLILTTAATEFYYQVRHGHA